MDSTRIGCRTAGLLLGLAAAGVALFVVLRPLPVEVARPTVEVPIEVFGLGTVEARIVSKLGFEVGATLARPEADPPAAGGVPFPASPQSGSAPSMSAASG